jgi:SAM-dependent MidA family methyltransferase
MTTLDPLLKAHSEKLTHLIRQEIDASGPLHFSRFMELALYAPGLGYYSAGSHKIGKGGDFITAPEITPLFAQCVAQQCEPFLTSSSDFLEIGAGSGAFAVDLLTALEKKQRLPQRYLILEVSGELRQRQQALLAKACPHLASRIHWLDTLPTAFKGIIFANEVLDAMPVDCFLIESQKLYERLVTIEKEHFTWCLGEPSTELTARIQHLETSVSFPERYTSEINLRLPAWIHSLADILEEGALLFIDYGYGRREYYYPAREYGTLTCFFQHRKSNNPFENIGLQDITTHVDFTLLAEQGITAGFDLCGFTTQASFLLANDLLQLAESVTKDPIQQYNQAQAIKTLTLPTEMGDRVKVMGFSKKSDFALNSIQDRRRDL